MSPKQWFSLLAFYISYLFFGASVFYHFEHKMETDRRAEALQERIEINEILSKFTAPDNKVLQDEILDKVSEYCPNAVTHPSKDEYVPPYIWSFYHSFFFSFIVCSTVGYGNISPNNTFGRMFMIFYALVGIPVNGILFAYLGDFFGKAFIKLYTRYKTYKLSTNRNWVPRKMNLIGQITLYLLPGLVFFIFLPATLFTYFEDWDYTISIYYAFVTLTTIGFGDYVPTFQKHQERTYGTYFVFYQLFILFWFITGVGYLVMIIGFLAQGLRSKSVKRIEHHLAMNIKETQARIWNGVTKDVGYIRKILNEVYFLKFKPVYKDPVETMRQFHIPKSQSCPNLFMDDEDDGEDEEEEDLIIPNIKHRERAYSECVRPRKYKPSSSSLTLNRIQSDSDLSNIDKEKTFAYDTSKASVYPGELLAKVVVALGGFRVDETQSDHQSSSLGIHGFSDSQILASEQNYSDWSLGTSEKSYVTPPHRIDRQRAISEVRIPMEHSVKASTEWTWSGANTQIKEIEKMRSKASKPKENLYKASLTTKLRYDSESGIDFPSELPTKMNATATNKTFLSKLNPFKRKISTQMKRHSLAPGQELDPQKYLSSTRNGRSSINSLAKSYLTQTATGRPSLFSMPCYEEEQSLLETTTIADLIRALEMVHTDANTTTSSQETLQSKKHRKLGTDHLNSPRKVSSLLTLFPKSFDSSLTVGTGMEASRPPRRRLYSCSNTTPAPVNNFDNRGKILGDNSPFTRHPSLRPPPYTTQVSQVSQNSPTALKRRFSVRASNLSVPPGQFHKQKRSVTINDFAVTSSPPSAVSFQRKLSWRPSPLATTQNESLPTNSGSSNSKSALWRQKFDPFVAFDKSSKKNLKNLCEDKLKEMDK